MTSSYSFGDDEVVDSFAFKKGAKKDDFHLEKNDKDCTVYILKKDISLSDDPTANIKVIYSSNKTYGSEEYANKFLTDLSEEIKESDNVSTRFSTAASLYSEDLKIKANYGEMKNVNSMNLDSALSEWVFAKGRKPGDTEIIKNNEGSYLVLYEDAGLPAYKATIFKEKFDEYFDAFTNVIISPTTYSHVIFVSISLLVIVFASINASNVSGWVIVRYIFLFSKSIHFQ
jgi:hypothetical protein